MACSDFDQCDITCFTIELVNKMETYEVRKCMIEHGYIFIGRLWFDDIWVKKEFIDNDWEPAK